MDRLIGGIMIKHRTVPQPIVALLRRRDGFSGRLLGALGAALAVLTAAVRLTLFRKNNIQAPHGKQDEEDADDNTQ